jgi:hypothetical protein
MNNHQTETRLQDVVRRESLSVLMYADQAFPWTTSQGNDALGQIHKVIQSEREAVAALGRFLVRRRTPPGYIGSFPSSFTTINFLSLAHLLPRLIEYERGSIAELERDLAAITDAEARAYVARLLELKRKHLPLLEGLLSSHSPQPAAS